LINFKFRIGKKPQGCIYKKTDKYNDAKKLAPEILSKKGHWV
jgi:hypothetical protein